MARIGAHDREGEPLTVATATGSEVIQFFLGDPQGWGAPTFPGGDAGKLRDALAEAGLEVFIHAPYGINVASANNRIRIPSRKLLSQQLAAAAAVGAKGLIVHGGHVTGGTDEGEGYANWRKAVERIERPIPLLIENTAGGDHAMARGLPALERLWDAVGDLSAGDGGGAGVIGFCLDTCHAYASVGSGRDRHASIETGTIDPELLLDVVRAAGAPVVSETPDPAADIAWLREHLTG